MEWDTAAAQCILEEAGGSLLQFDNLQPLVYNKPDLLNPHFIAMGAMLAGVVGGLLCTITGINAGIGGFWPLVIITVLIGPMTYLSHRGLARFVCSGSRLDADITDLEAFRVQINKENEKAGGAKLTMLAFLIKACVKAMQRYPEFNSSLDGDNLVLKKYFNIGFAADTPNGLVVPVIRAPDFFEEIGPEPLKAPNRSFRKLRGQGGEVGS